MSLFKIFDVAGSAMSAQSLRLNVTASNMANAESISGNAETAYKARHPVFAAVMDEASGGASATGVKILGVVESQDPPKMKYDPHNPLANEQGYVYASNVDPIEEMANMISASRSFQTNVEVLNTSKRLLLRALQIGE